MILVTVFLGGGGSSAQEAQVWRLALRRAERVLYWPFALDGDLIPDAESWITSSLRDLRIDVEVDTWPSLEDHQPAELARHDFLFVGGGLTSRLAAQVRDHGFEPAVRDFVTSGGNYYGGSAGAVLAAESIGIAALMDDDAGAAQLPGLGLIQGLSIFPHADRFTTKRQIEVADALGHDVLLLPEASGAVSEGKALRSVGPDQVAVLSPRGARSVVPRAGI
jgi:peptidase E